MKDIASYFSFSQRLKIAVQWKLVQIPTLLESILLPYCQYINMDADGIGQTSSQQDANHNALNL